MRTLGVLLAAGASRRFGPEDKLLTPYNESPLINNAARALLSANCDSVIAVTSSTAVAAVLPKGIEALKVAPNKTMTESLEAASLFAQNGDYEQILVVLGDMPGISAVILQTLMQLEGPNRACIYGGARMPPALLKCADLNSVFKHYSDSGARQLIATIPPASLLPLTANQALDIDRQEDLGQK